jgi:D-galactarolactone cycloisomerase
MKITSVEAIPLEAPMKGMYNRARQAIPLRARRCLLVKITTDDGLSGYGEGVTPVNPQAGAAVVQHVFSTFLIGQDPLHTQRIWESLYSIQASSRGYNRGYEMIALSAVDNALWDLKGKIMGQPVYKLLGGALRDKLPVYVTGLMMTDRRELVDLAQSYYEDGFRAMKLKIGIDAKQDIANVEALRHKFGPDLKIMVDANGGFDAKTAIRVGRAFEELDVFWFEEPVPMEDLNGMARVRESLDIYVAGGECEYTNFGFKEIFSKEALDVCQPDAGRAGGITGCQKIASLAQAFQVHYAPHVWGGVLAFAASEHLAISQPNFLILEFDRMSNPLREELPTQGLIFKEGYLHVSEKPGLGIELNEKQIKKFRAAS